MYKLTTAGIFMPPMLHHGLYTSLNAHGHALIRSAHITLTIIRTLTMSGEWYHSHYIHAITLTNAARLVNSQWLLVGRG